MKTMSDHRDSRDPGAFSDKVTTNIDVFIDEAVVQCDVQVVENIFIDDSK